MKTDNFDHIIKNKLDTLVDPGMPKLAWEDFSKRLDAELDPSFDYIIKEKLGSLEHKDITKFAWEDFSKRLDSELGPAYDETINERLDAEVQSKMKQYSVSFKSSHWQILKEQLERQAENLRSLYVSKTFELVIFALLVFTFYQNIQIFTPSPQTLYAAATSDNEVLLEDKTIYDNVIDKTVHIADTNDKESQEKSQPKLALRSQNKNPLSHSSPSRKPGVKIKDIISDQSSNYLPKQKKLNKDLVAITQENITTIPSEKSTILKDVFTASNTPSENYISDFPRLIYNSAIKQIPTLQAQLINNDDIASSIAGITILQKPKRNETFISLYVAGDRNLINTPFDQVYKLESKIVDSPGISLGVNIDYLMMETFEVGVGISYSSVNYQPQLVEERYGSLRDGIYDSSLSNIYFNIISVPINIKYHVLNREKWSLYSYIGASINTVATSEFNVNISSPTGSRFPRPALVGSRLETKDFTKGILQGGSLQENLFYTYTFGLGFQKEITKNMSVFTSLSYQQHALNKGVGPNEDRLNKLSIGLGAKYRL